VSEMFGQRGGDFTRDDLSTGVNMPDHLQQFVVGHSFQYKTFYSGFQGPEQVDVAPRARDHHNSRARKLSQNSVRKSFSRHVGQNQVDSHYVRPPGAKGLDRFLTV